MIVKALRKKLLVVLILFTMFFSNCGFTISAIASSEEFKVISKGIFGKDEISLKAYFTDKDGNETSKIIGDVNEKVNLVLEIDPQVNGVLKSGTLRLVPSDEGNLNFKISGTKEDVMNEFLTALGIDSLSTETDNSEEELPESETEETTKPEEQTEETKTDETAVNETTNEENNNPFLDFLDLGTDEEKAPDLEKSFSASEDSESEEKTEEGGNPFLEFLNLDKNTEIAQDETAEETEEDIIDEEVVIARKIQEEKLKSELENSVSDIEITSDNSIEVKYLKEETTIEIQLEFVQADKILVQDLMKKFKIQLSGEFINENLETVEIGKEEELNLGWSYNHSINLSSEYTKYSPFEVGEVNGTIVENRVVVSRSEENKYLPLKSISLEIEAPTIEGEYPTTVEVNASKLLATRGEDIGQVTFTGENWNYDIENHLVNITVNNDEINAINSIGEDEFIIIYRYEKYNEDDSNLFKKVKATVEGYSSPENVVIVKEINTKQDVKADVGQIVTYSASTTEEKINKAKIYANYNSEEALYETEIKTQANVNILTSDVLENVTIDFSNDIYKDVEGMEFEATDVKGKRIKFNYSEITALLENGGDITIKNKAGETIYVLSSSLIDSEDDVEVNLNNSDGLIISITNVANNGIINFEITKVIGKSNYEKASFMDFEQIESTITAEVKYKEIEDTVSLEAIKTVKDFEESKTQANIVLDRKELSTLQPNEDVELKIQLNNNDDNSDLYINPSFEVVFPRYVEDVTIQSINLLHEEGLRVLDFETYVEDETVKMRVDLIGTQTKFVDFDYTNGTNIIFDLNINVDDYTPAKEDQIKLYYCNEGVTNYQTQTKWTLGRDVPANILNTKNGFDVALISYQAPIGMIVANGILNYDGNLSEIKTLKQGDVSAKIPREGESRIATMELLALNNTGNNCEDVTFLGRIPFAGNKNVVTGEDLGTTHDTKLMDFITANVENRYMTEIYYSRNPEATSSFENGANGWTQSITDLSEVRSFLIIVKGTMAPGTSLQFTYDFEIPEKLPFESSIVGSFGAFYKNITESKANYESSVSEKAILYTEAGMKIDAKLEAITEEEVLKGFQRIEYKITVTNNGSVNLKDIKVKAEVPTNTYLVEEKEMRSFGDAGFEIDYSTRELEFEIDDLRDGEYREFTYVVVANNKLPLYKDTEEFITNKIKVISEDYAKEIESNEVSTKLIDSPIQGEITDNGTPQNVLLDTENTFKFVFKNVTDQTINNANVKFNVGNVYEVLNVLVDGKEVGIAEGDGYVSFDVSNLNVDSEHEIEANVKAKETSTSGEVADIYFEFNAEGIDTYRSSKIRKNLVKELLIIEETTNLENTNISEENEIILSTRISNIGSFMASGVKLEFNVPEPLTLKNVFANKTLNIAPGAYGKELATVNLPAIEAGDVMTIDIVYYLGNLPGNESNEVTIERRFYSDAVDITLERVKLVLLNDKKSNDELIEDGTKVDRDFIIANHNINTEVQNQEGSFKVSGNVWFDANRNSAFDNEETGIAGVNVYLYTTDNNMQKTTVTDSQGRYTFTGLQEGDYIVGCNFDDEFYQLATYRKSGVEEERNSEAVSVEKNVINAVTNKFESRSNVKDLNVGLQAKDTFDLSVNNYLASATVKTSGKEKKYTFKDLDVSKIEISPTEMDGAIIDFEYKIEVENIGNIAGYAEQIGDYLGSGLTFDPDKNPDWILKDGNKLYSSGLSSILINPGSKVDLRLILTKEIKGNSTQIVQNKAVLVKAFGQLNMEESLNENSGIQNTFITIETGKVNTVAIITFIALIIALLYYLKAKEIINIDLSSINLNPKKRTYKNKYKNNSSGKKIYK